MIENVSVTAANINTQTNNNNLNNRPKPVADPLAVQKLPIEQINPQRVNQTISNAESNFNAQKNNYLMNPDSIMNQLTQALELTPPMAENMRKLLLDKSFLNKNIKNNPELKMYFEKFLEGIKMDKGKMLEFIKFQQHNSTKFSGEFFNYLRQAVNTAPHESFKDLAGNFLKSYDCFLNQATTTEAIKTILDNITQALPKILHETFEDMSSKLLLSNPESSSDINLDLLKNEIIPYLSKYVAKTNDFGLVRDYISVLIHNVVRLEAGSKDNFSMSIENLFNYLKLNFKLEDKEIANLKQLLVTQYRSEGDKSNNAIDYMFKMIDEGMKDTTNVANKTVFEGIEQSLLVNENVQIPLAHIFLPVNFQGTFMFSELWFGKIIEEEKKKGKSTNEIIRTEVFNMFLTFDIDNVGYFETVAVCRDDKLQLELFIPPVLNSRNKEILAAISTIISKNGLKPEKLFVSECSKKRKFNEVFKSNVAKDRGINVFA